MNIYEKIIAHRGAPSLAHENTMESFSGHIRQVPILSNSMCAVRDKLLIAHHDPYIINGSEKISICDLTYNELASIASEHDFEVQR